ncbi:hypothetical protein [Yoonia sp.]|uniref:hypothetical protein n=1 Tax=Yoonia sp. TaxID=2212373 RepID=UPI003975D620
MKLTHQAFFGDAEHTFNLTDTMITELVLQLHILPISPMCDGGRELMLPSPSGPIPDESLGRS